MMKGIDALGPMAYPLLFCSLLMVSLLIERAILFLSLSPLSKKEHQIIIALTNSKGWLELDTFLDSVGNGSARIIKMFVIHRQQPRQIAEDTAELWLIEEKHRLHSRLGWLVLIAVVSPLFGLLGTVIGMIEAFKAMSISTGAITPALLADGLQQAMLTTAAGLCIAIPALIASHAFGLWANSYLQRIESVLNHVCLNVHSHMHQQTDATDIVLKEQIA